MALCLSLFLWSWPVYAAMPAQEAEVEKVEVESEPLNVKEYTQDYFKDIPIMSKIAKCESGYRQWETNGEVLTGRIDADDTGVMQVNKRYHLKASQEMGWDIETLEGNLQYARYLYETQGTNPWLASRACWEK